MGLVVFAVIGLYLLISSGVVAWAIRYARRKDRSPFIWGCGAALVMYLIPFWDWIPTVVAHRYYCEKEAGYWVYKTPEQWRAENLGVMETLVANQGAPSRHEPFNDGHGETTTFLLNDRFHWVVTQQDFSSWLSIIRKEQQVKDAKTHEVLARYVDFGAGNSVKNTVGPPGPMKFWLRSSNCFDGERNASLMRQFKNENFKGTEK